MASQILVSIERFIHDSVSLMLKGYHFLVDGWEESSWRAFRTISFWITLFSLLALNTILNYWFLIWFPTGISILEEGTFILRVFVTLSWVFTYSFIATAIGVYFVIEEDSDKEHKKLLESFSKL